MTSVNAIVSEKLVFISFYWSKSTRSMMRVFANQIDSRVLIFGPKRSVTDIAVKESRRQRKQQGGSMNNEAGRGRIDMPIKMCISIAAVPPAE
jgi:hypothetical protein